MELKTAEEIAEYYGINYDNEGDKNEATVAMKEYALQEVSKHLEIASKNATGLLDKTGKIFIVKGSITNIKIDLT